MSATATIEIRGEADDHGWAPCTIKCSEGCYTVFTQYRESYGTPEEYATRAIREHLSQHKPGRALDIEVFWEPFACCNVCADGVGDIHWPDTETLECRECETTWHIDGTGGERKEQDDD